MLTLNYSYGTCKHPRFCHLRAAAAGHNGSDFLLELFWLDGKELGAC